MKKLVVILLIGIYSTAVFGAGASSFDCCERTAAVFLNGFAAGNITAQNVDDDHCNNFHEGFASSGVHILSTSHHFSTRLYYAMPHTGLTSFTATIPAQQSLVSILQNNYSRSAKQTVSVYILHCVYRI